MADKMIYSVQGYDDEGRETVGCNTSVIDPDTPHDEIVAYLRGPYFNWIRPGFPSDLSEEFGERDFNRRLAATVRFEFTSRVEAFAAIRAKLGLSQAAYAEALGYADTSGRQLISKMESGKATITDRVMKMARMLEKHYRADPDQGPSLDQA